MKPSTALTSSGQDRPREPYDKLLIVGIGASAGGIEALQAFFEQVPADSGNAYVLILHLSPDHDSQLVQLLQTVAAMPVLQVTAKTRITPDHIYVIPPDKHLTLEDGHIIPWPSLQPEERRAPVDIFFRSLAEAHGPRAVAVVLSGTGANGSMGLKRVKEQGGAVFVQNPREAAFNEMPRHAIASGLVDEVLNVAELPARILNYQSTLEHTHIPEDATQRDEDDQQALRELFTQLRMRTGHDFSDYKRATLMRRIERRMAVRSLSNLSLYATYSNEHPEETQALLKDLLISVTNFFRDKTPFDALEAEVLPALFNSKSAGEQVRMWVAGCATGEEAYTLAMLCAERTIGLVDAPKVQIFATDIDESAITTAREGFYTLNDAADIPAGRLARFFTKEDNGYRVRREIRETILFAQHNFLKDPPFSRIDLVSCRNVLIYLNRPAQERVMETFHFALRPYGYLMLGTSESVDTANDLFKPFSREQHIYQSRPAAGQRPIIVPESIQPLRMVNAVIKPNITPAATTARIDYGDLHLQLLEEYAPPSLIVTAEFDLVHTSRHAGRYLQMAGGEPTQAILKLIREELRSELRNGLYQAAQTGVPVNSVALQVRTGEGMESVRIHVRPVADAGGKSGYLLVVFEPALGDQLPAIEYTSDEVATRHLEDELDRLRQLLRASNEQHEFQAEELKAGNEELQAMNEELRSATEELETSKEELQSINEELSTVNQELKVKVEESTMISNNLQNLINSTDIGTIFLDRSFRVVLFTPAVRSVFNLIPADYGRPLSDITSRLEYNNLLDDARTVLERLQLLEQEVRTTDGRVFLTRLAPYRTEEDRIQGVVISFVDITERKKAEEARRVNEEKYRTLFNSIDEGFSLLELIFDAEGHVTDYWHREDNPAFTRMTGIAHPKDRRMSELIPNLEPEWYHMLESVYRTGTPVRKEYPVQQLGQWYSCYLSRVGSEGSPFIAAIYDDITERKRREDEQDYLLKLSDILRSVAAPVAIEGAVTQLALTHFSADRCYLVTVEDNSAVVKRDAVRNNILSVEGIYPLDSFPLYSRVINGGRAFVVDNAATTSLMDAGLSALCLQMGVVSFINIPVVRDGTAIGIFCLVQTVPRTWTEAEISLAAETGERLWTAISRARAEEARNESETRLRVTMKAAIDYAIINTDTEGLIKGWSQGAQRTFGWQEREVLGRPAAIIFTPEDQAAGVPQQEMDTALREERAPDERWHLHKDGHRFFVSGVLRPIYDNGRLYGFVKVARDLTERRQAEDALRVTEERYRVALQSAEMAAWDWNIPADEVQWNAQHFLILGLQPESRIVTADFFMQFVHPDDNNAVSNELAQAVEDTGLYRMEAFRIVRADNGETRWMSGYGRAVAWQDGKASRMVGVMYDITRHVESSRALHEKQLKLEIAQRAARIGIWGFDLLKQQGIATPEWNELTGYPEPGETFELTTFLELVHPDDRNRLVAAHNKAVAERCAIELEFRLQHPQRGRLWVLKRGQYIPPYNGTNETLMGSLIDITERKELEQQKEQFIGIASHELRTPVTSIKAYTEILEEMFRETGDERSVALMQKMDVQVDRLTALIYSLLDTTRISEGKLLLEKSDFHADELIRETAETMQRVAGKKQIELQLDGPVTLRADRERIRQVLINLMSNALKYSPNADTIVVQSAVDEQQLTVCVQDFGIGISEEALPLVFGRFYRENETGSFSGLGLGLYISAGIVHEHGGTIWVKSIKGQGALFCFSLPLVRE